MADDEPGILATSFLINGRLIELDHQTQKYLPALAESYSSADGETVDMTLRDGLKFSDGRPLTSEDVAFTLRAIYDEKTDSPIFRDAMLVDNQPIETKVIDGRKLQFVFPKKVASIENYLENLVVLPKHALEPALNEGKLAQAMAITSEPSTFVGAGPFVVESVQAGERVTLKRNANYWRKDASGTQLPYLDTIVLEVVADSNNTLARLQQGTMGIADRIRASDFATLKSDASVNAHDAGPGLTTDHIWFNLNPATKAGEVRESTPKHRWFIDKRFRKAVAHAIDRKTIAGTTLQGLATPLYGFVPAGNRAWLDPNLTKAEFDLGRAKSLLIEAGFSQKMNGDKPELYDADGNRVEFSMIVRTENEPRKMIAAVVQEDLAKLGIALQVAPIDTKSMSERWSSSFDYDAALDGLGVSSLDPSSFAGFLLSSASVHQWRPRQSKPESEWEARIDELFAQQALETDPARRREIFNQIQSIVAEEMPIIPIVSRHVVSAANANVGNFVPSGILPYSLWNADRIFIR